ncbi:restriction endonuclease subunit S [Helicobacter pylori]
MLLCVTPKMGFKSCSCVLLPKHAILFSSRAPIGYVAIAEKRLCTNQGFKSIIPNKKIYFEFLYYLLKYHKDNISNIGGGTTFKEVSGATLGLFEVKIPPTYYEQQKIARVLSILDQKIENNHKINELLHTLAYKIYEYYFKYKPKNAKLEQIIIENPKSNIMVKNAQKTQDKYPFFTSGDNILSYPKAIIDGRNCFLNTGGNAGIKFYVGKASYSTDTWCICANEFSDYLYLLLSSIKTHINQSFFQGTSLKHLQKNLLKKYPIYMPSAHEIKKFNQIMMPLLTLISINTRTSKKLEQIRDFLLPLLLKQQVKPK